MGRVVSEKTREKIRMKLIGLKRNDAVKEKLRLIRISQIKKLGAARNYNPVACKFMDEYGKQNGYYFQHAMNGGEIILSGYFVDGYDKEKSVVFEYDEPKHEYTSQKLKDLKRQSNIIIKNNCKFIRYSEKYNKLYECFNT